MKVKQIKKTFYNQLKTIFIENFLNKNNIKLIEGYPVVVVIVKKDGG